MAEEKVYYSIDEVAARLGVSARWLADQCREELVEHVHIARKRRFTPSQVDLLVAKLTVHPPADEMLDAARRRVVRRLTRQGCD